MTLLTMAETAQRLRVSTGTVRTLARREGLPLIRLTARRYLVSEEGLRKWLDARVVSGAPDPVTEPRRVTGAFPSRYPRLVEDDADRSGSTARRRPPAASSKPSSVVSLAASRPRRAG